MIDASFVLRHTFPAAFELLPVRMGTTEAAAMLLAIGMQESKFLHRRQVKGPARGFWQFERGGGVAGVMQHAATRVHLQGALVGLHYPTTMTSTALHTAIEHNDTLACVMARLLLWSTPGLLPGRADAGRAWRTYIAGWRPGKPHPETWADNYDRAWRAVSAGEDT